MKEKEKKTDPFFSVVGKVVCVVLLLAVFVFFLVPLGCIIFNKSDVVAEGYLEVTSLLLAFPSLLLAVYSVWSAWSGGKTTSQMVSKLDRLISGQEAIRGALNSFPAGSQGGGGGPWDGGGDGYHD